MNHHAIVITNGCPENRLDCAETEQLFLDNGWEIVAKADLADVIVLNLCGLLDGMEEHSLAMIKTASRKKKKSAKVVVTGCLPKINYRSIERNFSGEVVRGHNLTELTERLHLEQRPANYSANYLIPSGLLPIKGYDAFLRKINPTHLLKKIKNGIDLNPILHCSQSKEYQKYFDKFNLVQPNTFYIKVSSGCMHACAYCAVKKSRGAVKSKPIDAIKSEVLEGLANGFTQFSFIGTDLGSYGKDLHTNLTELLQELVSIDAPYSIKLRNVHPQFLIEQLPAMVEIVKSGKITHITSAFQHANDRILKLMKRHYKSQECLHALNMLKSAKPQMELRSQLIVGFPGETTAEFEDNLNLMDSCNADFFEIYPYSSRVGTVAAKLPQQLPVQTVNRRKYLAVKKVLDVVRSNGRRNGFPATKTLRMASHLSSPV